ncbi:hypothetical protein PRIPAC_90272 [Pristionchus pacificus]|uniref:Uncharacterized protein n=1 Tax=Pristionchus pacificus TaxID=54126 RepID=A0A2A6B9N3_PRIPA|nr:hypothetical protein PRIPAC_90272 [Pristionchus pacificus]|eukprot:PDM62595.1 hypothetical protein PRIPAC_52037 [Pristionchus pacificus]
MDIIQNLGPKVIGTGNTVVWNEAEECKTVTTTRSSKGDSRKRERGAGDRNKDGKTITPGAIDYWATAVCKLSTVLKDYR